MARERTRGTRDAAGTQVSAKVARDPIPAAPRGIDRAPPPAGAVFLVAASPAPRSCDSLLAVSGEAQARRARTSGTRISAVAFQPPPRLVVGGSAGRSGSAQRRVGAGAFPRPRRANCRPVSRPLPRHAPHGPPPGAMAAESHRRGRRPAPDPPGQPPGGPPKDARDRSRAAADRCGQEAQNRNIVKVRAARRGTGPVPRLPSAPSRHSGRRGRAGNRCRGRRVRIPGSAQQTPG